MSTKCFGVEKMQLHALWKTIKDKQNMLNSMVSSNGLSDPSVLLLSEEIDKYIVDYYRQLEEVNELEATCLRNKLCQTT